MVYTVWYREHSAGEVKSIDVIAKSKFEAWDKAVYEELDTMPYVAWVVSVTYQNGNYKQFANACESKPY